MLTDNVLLEEALQALPEFRMEYQKLVSSDYIDKESGNHVVFSYAFVPVLVEAIQSGNKECAERMFSFIEKMAGAHDHLVGEVCDFTILEALNDEVEDESLLSFMGPETKKDFLNIKRYMQ